jgi:hypothetical protein
VICPDALIRIAVKLESLTCSVARVLLPLAMTDSRPHAALATSEFAATFTGLLDPHRPAPVFVGGFAE